MTNIHDNICVRSGQSSGDFFYISCSPDDNETGKPYEVVIGRYTVPGRMASYTFDYTPPMPGYMSRIRFCSETDVPLTKAAEMLKRDLNLPQVVKMLRDICEDPRHFYYSRILVEGLLFSIGRGTKSYRACNKALTKSREKYDR